MSVSYVADPATLVPVASVDYTPDFTALSVTNATANSSIVTLTDYAVPGLTGVSSIRFAYLDNNGGQLVREIDFTGAPTAFPEPRPSNLSPLQCRFFSAVAENITKRKSCAGAYPNPKKVRSSWRPLTARTFNHQKWTCPASWACPFALYHGCARVLSNAAIVNRKRKEFAVTRESTDLNQDAA